MIPCPEFLELATRGQGTERDINSFASLANRDQRFQESECVREREIERKYSVMIATGKKTDDLDGRY